MFRRRDTRHLNDVPTKDTQDSPKVGVDPIKLSLEPIIRARAKRSKDAVVALIDRVWGETVARLIEHSWTNKLSMPFNILQAQLAHP
ncbi:hypothetical protein J1N35_004317 [Gossypium stocksii]|uniref:Uncharacterized protein n=1 Tax=Gossypium stocksii TaxID=47602 RepID=A0A9D4AFZ7_9ROSI|nr:hypothetical protein J1N35_004317 [Gossypium stocksii]